MTKAKRKKEDIEKVNVLLKDIFKDYILIGIAPVEKNHGYFYAGTKINSEARFIELFGRWFDEQPELKEVMKRALVFHDLKGNLHGALDKIIDLLKDEIKKQDEEDSNK